MKYIREVIEIIQMAKVRGKGTWQWLFTPSEPKHLSEPIFLILTGRLHKARLLAMRYTNKRDLTSTQRKSLAERTMKHIYETQYRYLNRDDNND